MFRFVSVCGCECVYYCFGSVASKISSQIVRLEGNSHIFFVQDLERLVKNHTFGTHLFRMHSGASVHADFELHVSEMGAKFVNSINALFFLAYYT